MKLLILVLVLAACHRRDPSQPLEIKPTRAPSWHVADVTTTAKLNPLLIAEGFADLSGVAVPPSSASVSGTKAGTWVRLAAWCNPHTREPELGSAFYRDGDCTMMVAARERTDDGPPAPAESRRILESILSK